MELIPIIVFWTGDS